jgi:uncharacterized membrane protein
MNATEGLARPPRPSRAARVLAIAASMIIAFGICLRFFHVDHKVLWDDEVIALFHILGQTEREIVVSAADFHSVADLRAILHPTGALRPIAATVSALQTEDPQHPPLYYIIARMWVAMFGDSVAALRTLSAIIGVIALPCVFWLAFELFGSALTALAATALVAISPVDLIYATQIREYGLWLVAMLVMSALFVRALRTATVSSWLLYALAFCVSLYVFPGSFLIAIAHAAVAVLFPTSLRNRIYALGAVILGCALFAPWLVTMLTSVDQINRGMVSVNGFKTSPLGVARLLIDLVRLDLFDINGRPAWLVALMTLPVMSIIGYAIYDMRNSRSDVRRLFVWTLIVCSTLPYVLADVATGGHRTLSVRYFIPLFLAIDLALVDLFFRSAFALSSSLRRPRAQAWSIVFFLVVAVRIGSCLLAENAQTWWSEYNNRSISVATAINDADRPLLMGDDYIVWALSISEYADPRVRVSLNPRCYLCTLTKDRPDLAVVSTPKGIGSVFLLGPSNSLQQNVIGLLRKQPDAPAYRCINIRDNCKGSLQIF